MDPKTRVYVDTSAFIAFLDRSDTYHAQFVHFFSSPPVLLTSSLVISEGHGWFLRRYDAYRALQFLDFIDTLTPLHIVSVGEKEIEQGSVYLKKFRDQNLTLADAVGLWIMDKHRVATCASTDRHLTLTGKPLFIHTK